MADSEQLMRLKAGVVSWNQWRQNNSEITLDLRGADLRDEDLSDIDLMEADLSGANLAGADLMDARLTRVNFSNAIISGAELSGAYLVESNFETADLSSAELTEANLTEASLKGANLTDAYLHAANLTGASFTGANLSSANFWETVFADTDLGGSLGLETCRHNRPSTIDHRTLVKSGPLPLAFLRGCGLPDAMIQHLPLLLGTPSRFYSCFISYSHADKTFARRLHDALQGRGIRCWLDEKQLRPGDDLHDEVERGIRLWDKVLLCCSKDSLSSWWVDDEIAKAFAKEQKLMRVQRRRVLALIPLDLDGYIVAGNWNSGKSSQVRERLAADFKGWRRDSAKFDQQIENVIRALRLDDAARELPPVSML
jgi:hypothetical protein